MATPAGNTVTYVSNQRDNLARNVVWPSDWESASLHLFSELAREARWILDVGAFTGIYSLIAVADSDGARVIAFEPNPQILPNLHRNLAVNQFNDCVQVVEAAVSSKPGHLSLTVPAEDRTAASICGSTEGERIDVEVTTLDLSVGDLPIDLIKIDVEGAEASVLRGATMLLSRHHPDILVELRAETFDEVSTLLGAFGYGTIRHIGPLGLREVSEHIDEPRYDNYLFATRCWASRAQRDIS